MILFDEGALTDLERIFAFNLEMGPERALAEIEKIRSAVMILEEHPRIGRLARGEIRELVISVARVGYVALYQYEELDHLVRVLAVRHQREAGYRER